jgi:hypothetical protein
MHLLGDLIPLRLVEDEQCGQAIGAAAADIHLGDGPLLLLRFWAAERVTLSTSACASNDTEVRGVAFRLPLHYTGHHDSVCGCVLHI